MVGCSDRLDGHDFVGPQAGMTLTVSTVLLEALRRGRPVEALAFERLGWVTMVPTEAGRRGRRTVRSLVSGGDSIGDQHESYQVRPRLTGRGMSCLDALIAMIVRCLLGRTALVPVRVRSLPAAEHSVRPLCVAVPALAWSGGLQSLWGMTLSGPGGPRARGGGGCFLIFGPPVRRF